MSRPTADYWFTQAAARHDRLADALDRAAERAACRRAARQERKVGRA